MGASHGRGGGGERRSKKNPHTAHAHSHPHTNHTPTTPSDHLTHTHKHAHKYDPPYGHSPSSSPPTAAAATAGVRSSPSHSPPNVALHSPPQPTLPPPQPTFDENSHPFHAPLDHVREEERPLTELSASTHFDVPTLRKLQIIFTDIAESDVDDGIIDGNELTDAMGLEPSCLLARTIFRIFDITHQKKIDFGQWVRTISALSPEANLEEKIKFSFSLYDLNGDGEIDVEELRAMLEAAVLDENVLHLTSAEVREWCDHTLSEVDRDGNGKIDYQEYRSMVQNSVKFLESFTLDIHELCSSFRFGKRHGSRDKLTAHEIDQRLLWFRARQRQYNSHSNHSSNQDAQSQDGSQHQQNASGQQQRGTSHQQQREPTNVKPGGSGIHKPIDVASSHPSSGRLGVPNTRPAASASAEQSSSPDGTPGSSYGPPRIHSHQGSGSEGEDAARTALPAGLTPVTVASIAVAAAVARDRDSAAPVTPGQVGGNSRNMFVSSPDASTCTPVFHAEQSPSPSGVSMTSPVAAIRDSGE